MREKPAKVIILYLCMRQEVNGLGQTFLLKNEKTPAKKFRLLFCRIKGWILDCMGRWVSVLNRILLWLKVCLKKPFEEYDQFARSGKPRCLRRDRQVEVLNGG